MIVRTSGRGSAPGRTCSFGAFSAENLPGACWRPYADGSPFNVGVGSAPQTLSGSRGVVSRTLGFGPAEHILGGVSDTADDWDHPLYYSRPSDPLYRVHCTRWTSSCELEGVEVRIPAQARPAGGGDASLGVIDQASGWEYDFWQVQSKPARGGVITVSHGGMTRIGTSDADGLGSSATAAHFGTAAGVIRPAELEAGRINHALFMVVKCTNGTYVWPAQGPGAGRSCASMGLANDNAPAMGQHFYLDMSEAEIAALAVPGWKRTILRAMARYGMFVGDTGGGSWRLKIESGSSLTSFGHRDPWVRLGRRYGVPTWRSSSGATHHIFNLQEGVDWRRLRVAKPCVARGAC